MKKRTQTAKRSQRFIYGFKKVRCSDQSVQSTGICDTDPTSPLTATTTHFGF